MTIIRITGSKAELSKRHTTQSISKVRKECGRDDEQYDGRLALHDDMIHHIKSEVKSVDENEPETTDVLKCIISHDIDNPMKTCANKFIRRTKSVVVNHKDQVEVRFSASLRFSSFKFKFQMFSRFFS